MNIIIEVGHPKHVHFWKNIINILTKKGHKIKIVAVDKDMTLYLLKKCGFDYEIIGKNYKGLFRKAYGLVRNDMKLLNIAKKFKPDIFVSDSPYSAHTSKLLNKPHIAFSDTEQARLTSWLTFPFSEVVCTPACYYKMIDPRKHLKYNGYEELAYLHPNYFEPDPSVLDEQGINKNERFIVIRMVSWNASHDIGDKGFDNPIEVIEKLEKYGKVLVTAEAKLNDYINEYKIIVPPEKIHSLLYYASLHIGESSSMASESALLGTPSIFVSTSKRGYIDELESKYDLLYTFSDRKNAQEKAIKKAIQLLEDKNIKMNWQKKREKLLNEKIDVAEFISDFIEGYPESFINYKKFNQKVET